MKRTGQLIAYADCFSGVSGDMFLGALLDCGLPLEKLQETLLLLGLQDYTISAAPRTRSGIAATGVTVTTTDRHPHRTFKDIELLITNSQLPTTIQDRAQAIFLKLAAAEAAVHGCLLEEVHFHEVGCIDSIIDIVGSAIGLDYFGITALFCSALPMPSGWVQCQHGTLPLPAPAVCKLLEGVPCYGIAADQEMVTPTGAAILTAQSSGYGPMPNMTPSRIGYGAGSQECIANRPNLFRLFIGNSNAVSEEQEVIITEANLDDWSPEGFQFVSERLFQAGALDVVLIPIHMKKGRPGFTIQIISAESTAPQLQDILFTETTTIGLRFRKELRRTLPRESGFLPLRWGKIEVKKIDSPAGIRLTPEYEACKKMAMKNKVPLAAIYREVQLQSIDRFEPQKPNK